MPKSKVKTAYRGRRVARKGPAGSLSAVVESPFVVVPPPQRSELKYYADLAQTQFGAVSTTLTTYSCYSKLAQGASINQRIGLAIEPRSLTIEGTLQGGQSNLATDDSVNTFRVLIVAGPPGVTPSSINVSSIIDVRSTPGVDVVLADRIVTLESPSRDGTGYMPAVKRFKLVITDLRKKIGPIYFTGGAGTVKNRELWICVVSDSAVAPSPGFINGALKFDYYDL